MKRYDIIKKIMENVTDEFVICNIGLPCKELYSINDRPRNFYMLGSLGLVSSIGFGLALSSNKKIIVIDGDGSILMNPNSLITASNNIQNNLLHIIIDNGVHGSTGNEKTYTSKDTSLEKFISGLGIFVKEIKIDEINQHLTFEGYKVLIIKCESGNADVPVIPLNSIQIKNRFMEEIKNDTS